MPNLKMRLVNGKKDKKYFFVKLGLFYLVPLKA